MPVENLSHSSKFELVSSAGVVVCILALLLLSVSSWCAQCYEKFKNKTKRKDETKSKRIETKRMISLSDEQRKISFQIPTMTKTELIQDRKDSCKGQSKSSTPSIKKNDEDNPNNNTDEPSEDDVFLKNRVQPSVDKLAVPKKTSFGGMYGLKKDLYKKKSASFHRIGGEVQTRSQSLTTAAGGGGKHSHLGRIWFQLYYSDQVCNARVTVICKAHS